MAAAGVAKEQRTKVIMAGIAAAVVLRIVFAIVTTQLMAIVGLTLAGGLLLLWVCWKLFRELRDNDHSGADDIDAAGDTPEGGKSMTTAVWQVVLADVSMSLDNVLAVAGVARDHPEVLVAGLALSVVLMGVAASAIARLLNRWPWIAYIGLAIIVYVAATMIWLGGLEVAVHAGAVPAL
jgi:YjbE family integral membrane protein